MNSCSAIGEAGSGWIVDCLERDSCYLDDQKIDNAEVGPNLAVAGGCSACNLSEVWELVNE